MKARIAGLERALLASVPLWAVLVSEGSAACTPATPTNGQTVTCTGTVPTGFVAPAGVTGLTVNTTADAVLGEQRTVVAANAQFAGIQVNANSTVNNLGSVVTGSNALRNHYGINLNGAGTILNNSGSVVVTDPGTTNATRLYGVYSSDDVLPDGVPFVRNVIVNNAGTISTIQNGSGRAQSVYAGEKIASFVLNNTGLIVATRTAAPSAATSTQQIAAVDSDDDAETMVINNFARGTIQGVGRAANGIRGNAAEITINNSGRIAGGTSGDILNGTNGAAINVFGGGDDEATEVELHNRAGGLIVGNVRFADTAVQDTTTTIPAASARRNSETVNEGRIEGSFLFGKGNHALTNTGTITGGLTYIDVADSVNTVNLGTGSVIGGNIVARGLGTNSMVLTGQGTLTSNVTGFTTLTVGTPPAGGGGGGGRRRRRR